MGVDAAPVGWGALLGEGAAANVGAGPFVRPASLVPASIWFHLV